MAATLTGGVIGAMGGAGNGIGSVLGVASGAGKSGNCKNGTTIPFMIQGTASDPKFLPDVGGVAASLLKSELGCTGGTMLGAGEKGATTPANAVETLGGLFGKKKKP